MRGLTLTVILAGLLVALPAWGVTISYKVESGDSSVTLTNDYDLDAASSSQSTLQMCTDPDGPALYQDRLMNLEGDNYVEQTIEGESGGEDTYTGVDIIGAESAMGLTVTTQSYSDANTHSLGQTLDGSGDVIYSVLGAGDIKVSGAGVTPGPGTLSVDVGAHGNGAVVGVGAFGNAKLTDSTLCVETGHSSHALGDIDAKGDTVVAGAAAGKIDASAEGTFSAAPLQGNITAEGEVEAAGVGVGASGGSASVKTSLGAETKDGTSSWMDIDKAKGDMVGAGSVAGHLGADGSFTADLSQGNVTAEGELDAEMAGSAVVAEGHHAVVKGASLHADTSDDGTSTDMDIDKAKGDMVGVGSIAGHLGAEGDFTADLSQGNVTADGYLSAEMAGSAVVAEGHHAVVKGASLHAETSDDGTSTDMDIDKAKAGDFVAAGSIAGQLEGEGVITTTLDWPPEVQSADGTISVEAAAIGGAAVGNPLDPAKLLSIQTSADTSHSAEASGDMHASGAAVVAGAAAGNAYADSSLGIGAEGAVVGGLGSYQGIDGIGDSTWYTDHYKIKATGLNAQTDLATGTSVGGNVAVSGGLYDESEMAAGVAAGYAFLPSGTADGEQDFDVAVGVHQSISGHGTAHVNKLVPNFGATWTH